MRDISMRRWSPGKCIIRIFSAREGKWNAQTKMQSHRSNVDYGLWPMDLTVAYGLECGLWTGVWTGLYHCNELKLIENFSRY